MLVTEHLKKSYLITIIGVGNIGYRYLESLINNNFCGGIILIEPNKVELEKKVKKLSINKEISITLKDKINYEVFKSNLIIISTTSFYRFDLLNQIIKGGYHGKLLLEKFLFPNQELMDKGINLLRNYPNNIYVNQWMRRTSFKDLMIKYKYDLKIIRVKGTEWGMLCNSVHFLDLFIEIFKNNDFVFKKSESFCDEICDSKRSGFNEFKGKLVFYSEINGLQIELIDQNNKYSLGKIYIDFLCNTNNKKFIYEAPYLLDLNNEEKFYIPFLSEYSYFMIMDILEERNPLIPSFANSQKHHQLLLSALKQIVNIDVLNNLKIT